MFDRTFVHVERGGPSHISVSEQRAPTDESVRLLREMEKAARSQLVESLQLKDNVIQGVAHRYTSTLDFREVVLIAFSLNGHKLSCEIDITYGERAIDNIDKIYKAIAEEIARFLLMRVGPMIDKGTQ